MRQFMGEDFLLENPSAVRLYKEYASQMPIIDYHCHLDAKEIFENKRFTSITEAWLYGDHYKWRAMRTRGIDEEYITGNASDYDKFLAWVKTIEKCMGNPLYHWTHLEMQRFFQFYEPLTEKNAAAAWEKMNALLAEDEYRARGLIAKANVKVIATTDDPTDSLEYHRKIREDETVSFQVVPTFRPDKGMGLNAPGFRQWVEALGRAAGITIAGYSEFLKAMEQRLEFFHQAGCRSADHSLEKFPYLESSPEKIAAIFKQALAGKTVDAQDVERYQTALLQFWGKQYARLDWAMQLHIGPMRNNNSLMFEKLGADSGFDSIHDHPVAYSLSRLLDSLARKACLPRTILYAINPKDYYVVASMLGNFQGDGIPGKIQFGTAWWFNDHKLGMEQHLTTLGNLGLISGFVGMVTDSRSFLSYTRHEYFRRILCNLFGTWIENGELPAAWEEIGMMIADICFHNAKNYFGFK